MAENKKTLTVTQEVKELMFDIMNKSYQTGQAREFEGAKNYEACSNMQASEDLESSYQLRRSLANAFSSLKSLLGEYLDENESTSNNIIPKEIDDDGPDPLNGQPRNRETRPVQAKPTDKADL